MRKVIASIAIGIIGLLSLSACGSDAEYVRKFIK